MDGWIRYVFPSGNVCKILHVSNTEGNASKFCVKLILLSFFLVLLQTKPIISPLFPTLWKFLFIARGSLFCRVANKVGLEKLGRLGVPSPGLRKIQCLGTGETRKNTKIGPFDRLNFFFVFWVVLPMVIKYVIPRLMAWRPPRGPIFFENILSFC